MQWGFFWKRTQAAGRFHCSNASECDREKKRCVGAMEEKRAGQKRKDTLSCQSLVLV